LEIQLQETDKLVGELIGEVSRHVLAKIRGSTKTALPVALRIPQ
jgi:hypothetical protein